MSEQIFIEYTHLIFAVLCALFAILCNIMLVIYKNENIIEGYDYFLFNRRIRKASILFIIAAFLFIPESIIPDSTLKRVLINYIKLGLLSDFFVGILDDLPSYVVFVIGFLYVIRGLIQIKDSYFPIILNKESYGILEEIKKNHFQETEDNKIHIKKLKESGMIKGRNKYKLTKKGKLYFEDYSDIVRIQYDN